MLKHILTLIWNKRRQNFLLFLEIFIAFMILFAVFTFVIHNFSVYNSPMGFETTNRWMAQLEYDDDADSAQIVQIREILERELEAKPEIKSVAYGWYTAIPFGGWWSETHNTDGKFEMKTRLADVGVDYKETMGLEMLDGRWFTTDDFLAKDPPCVITEQLWEDAFDRGPVLDSIRGLNGHLKVIGIVKNFKMDGEFKEEHNFTFKLIHPHQKGMLFIELNEDVSPAFEEEVNKTIAEITKRNDFIIQHLERQKEQESRSKWIPIISFLSISGFLILNVALGLFGVLWFNISKRRGEIGVRRAMGATKSEISKQFIGEIMMVSMIGIVVATIFAVQFPLMKLLDFANEHYYLGMLYAALLILVLVLLCAYYPSRQAAKIHPAIALHEE